MTKPTRARMIDAAVDALRRHGLSGMSFTEVLADSGAARGAIYHHFPGGKSELVAEAARLHGREVTDRLAELSGPTPRAVVESFLTFARPVIADATHGRGCAVAAVTTPADTDDLCRLAATTFTAWADQLTTALTAAGMPASDAADLSQLLITMLEGAQILCRATGDTTPFDRAARAALAAAPLPH
ncbi:MULTISPECIES: TetR/AcrR family transcriptional regulator [unclassified Nocardia]|uniref:TetR/AcrR family transcriptional regulator n=1 Tax=unclassified Nocardia TaxID=2637762 RepID=UPI0024A7ABFF|nr:MULTISPECIES: TetR/AcrR family transcriptional regulator [unclassified Nocardia]